MFNVGDIVWCIKKGEYKITDYHVLCVVSGVSDNGHMYVKPLRRAHPVFEVAEKYFEIASVKME